MEDTSTDDPPPKMTTGSSQLSHITDTAQLTLSPAPTTLTCHSTQPRSDTHDMTWPLRVDALQADA